jgi:hypothetical protein
MQGEIMPLTYVCPKCNGTDVYFAKKQIITGIGGVYGNRQKEVDRPFCRKCDIEAQTTGRDEDGMKKFWRIYGQVAIVVLVVLGVWWIFASLL